MRTLKSDSRWRRFSSYEPNRVSTPSSGTAILRIEERADSNYLLLLQRIKESSVPNQGSPVNRGHPCSYLPGRRLQRPEVQLLELLRVDRRRRPAMRSTAAAVFGNAMTSRIDALAARIATMRSRPSAMPPCGGVPYSSASRKKPNRVRRLLVADVQQPEDLALHGRCRGYGCCRRRSRCRSARGRRPSRAPRPAPTRACRMSSSIGRRERMVHRLPPLVLGVPLEQREVDDPEELELVGLEQLDLLRERSGAADRASSTSRRARPPPAAAGRRCR